MKKMRVGVAADHGGFALKERLAGILRKEGYAVRDFGAFRLERHDDFPDFVLPLARDLAHRRIDRGISICTSGIGASIAANKVPGVRAGLVHDIFSARQGVEDDDMNVLCLGAHRLPFNRARRLTGAFLGTVFSGKERFRRRLFKIHRFEKRIIKKGAL